MKAKIFKISLCIAVMLFGLLGGLNAENDSKTKTLNIKNMTPYVLAIAVKDTNNKVLAQGYIPDWSTNTSLTSDSDQFLIIGSKIEVKFKGMTFTETIKRDSQNKDIFQGAFGSDMKAIFVKESSLVFRLSFELSFSPSEEEWIKSSGTPGIKVKKEDYQFPTRDI